jgi:hypothetical protein
MTIKMLFAAVGILALLGTGVVQAQTAAPMTKPAAADKAKPMAKPARTAKSLECSKEADAKNLHGKPRKKFMSTCKKA